MNGYCVIHNTLPRSYKIKELSLPSNFIAKNKLLNCVFLAVDKNRPINFKHQKCLFDKATFFFFFCRKRTRMFLVFCLNVKASKKLKSSIARLRVCFAPFSLILSFPKDWYILRTYPQRVHTLKNLIL